jgi:antirestriction protein ArdC
MKKVWLLRYYNVFNLSQCENIPERLIPQEVERQNNPIPACKKIIKGMKDAPVMKPSNSGAYYVPATDELSVPPMKSFIDSQSYYLTLFHELIHSTGHEKRLNRPEVMAHHAFGTEPYSLEELTAEMGACFLASAAGIVDLHFDNNVAYIQSWLKVFKYDTKFIFKAGGQAQRAADLILNVPFAIYSEEQPKEASVAE